MVMVIMVVCPINVEASNNVCENNDVYYDTEEGRYIQNLDQYLLMLNSDVIAPYASTIEMKTNSSVRDMLFSISEPSKKCSNIFGHKWSSWGNWTVTNVVHVSNRICPVYMERERYCTRTYCGAWQTETDIAFIENCNH